MPVSVSLPYAEYAVELAAGRLTIDGVRCSRCRAAELRMTSSTLRRGIVLFSLGDRGDPELFKLEATIAIARCLSCRARVRVLPADLLARKTYSLPVIEHCCETRLNGTSLRQAVRTLGAPRPSHATLHAWVQGLGAHANGRRLGDVPGADPISAVIAETESRHPDLPTFRTVTTSVSSQLFRSGPSQERLIAAASLLQHARALGQTGLGSVSQSSPLTDRSPLRIPGSQPRAGGFEEDLIPNTLKHRQKRIRPIHR